MNKVYFVGGYYRDCKIKNEDEIFDKIFDSPKIFDIEGVLKMGFIGDFVDEYNENNKITDEEDENYLEDAWDLLEEEEKGEILAKMMEDDDLAGIILCENLEKANETLKEELERINDLNEEYEVTEKVQNEYGDYIEVYKKKDVE